MSKTLSSCTVTVFCAECLAGTAEECVCCGQDFCQECVEVPPKMSFSKPYPDCSCIECGNPAYFDQETGVQVAPRAVSYSQEMDDAEFAVLLCDTSALVWPAGLLQELELSVVQRVDKYIKADEYVFGNQLEGCEFANEYYGKLSGCLRCGEIVTSERYQVISMGVCHKCAAYGLRGNVADEFNEWTGTSYVIGKDCYKFKGWKGIYFPEDGISTKTFFHGPMIEFPELEHPEWLLISSEELYLDPVFQRVAEGLATMVWRGKMNMYVAKSLLLMLSPRIILLTKLEKVAYYEEPEYGLHL